jgi:integrase
MRTPTTTLFKAKKLAKPNGKRTWVIHRRSHGSRERIYFESEKEARREANDRNRKIEAKGTVVQLTQEEQIYAAACIEDLAKIGKTLRDATDYFLAQFSKPPAISGKVLVDRVLKEYERRLKAKEVGKHHLDGMKDTAKKLKTRYGETPIDAISPGNVKEWITGLPLAASTRNRHLGAIGAYFALAKEWDLIDKNPFEGMTKFKSSKNAKIAIFTPEELRKVLNAVTSDWLAVFAINAFTGLRQAEIKRLEWSEVKLDRNLIDLPFEKSKNKRRKLIEVPAYLRTLLEPLVGEGRVHPKRRFDLEVKRLKENFEVKWPNNVLRHSFCSHAVALKGSGWTAAQADHSESILRSRYLEVVTKEQAEAYFEITT